jgi:hypothetical protein
MGAKGQACFAILAVGGTGGRHHIGGVIQEGSEGVAAGNAKGKDLRWDQAVVLDVRCTSSLCYLALGSQLRWAAWFTVPTECKAETSSVRQRCGMSCGKGEHHQKDTGAHPIQGLVTPSADSNLLFQEHALNILRVFILASGLWRGWC